MEPLETRLAYDALAPENPLKRDIDRVYGVAISLLLQGFYDAHAAARNGDPWPPIGEESPHVYGAFFVIAPDMANIRRHCTRTVRFGDEPIHDEAFFSTLVRYLHEHEDQARYIVDGELFAMGKVLNFPDVYARAQELAGIDDPLEHITALCVKLMPTIARQDGFIGTKTQSALLYAIAAEDTIIIQNSVPESPYGFTDETFNYQTGLRSVERVNPAGGGRVVHCSRKGAVRSVTLEIMPGVAENRCIGYALVKDRTENPAWPIALVERSFEYDPECKFVHRKKEWALDPTPYRSTIAELSPHS